MFPKGSRVPIKRGRYISTRLPVLEAELWRALKSTSDWIARDVTLFGPHATPALWSQLCRNVRGANGTSGHLGHGVHDRIHYALGGAPPTIDNPAAAASPSAKLDGRLEVILETLRQAEFNLLSAEQWAFCGAHDFTFDFPSRIRAEDQPHLYERANEMWGAPPPPPDCAPPPILIFYRNVGSVTMSGLFIEAKIGLIIKRVSRIVLRAVCRGVCRRPVGLCAKMPLGVGACCGRAQGWGDVPHAESVELSLRGARKDDPACIAHRSLLSQQLPTVVSILRALVRTIVLSEVTLREIVTVSKRSKLAFKRTNIKFDLALYDEVPFADAEMVCDIELQLRPLDKLKVGVVALGALWTIAPMIWSLVVASWLGGSLFTVSHLFFAVAVGGACSKIFASFNLARDTAQRDLEKTLLRKLESKQEGVLLTLASAAYQQECKEEIVGYAALHTLRGGVNAGASLELFASRAEEMVEMHGTRASDFGRRGKKVRNGIFFPPDKKVLSGSGSTTSSGSSGSGSGSGSSAVAAAGAAAGSAGGSAASKVEETAAGVAFDRRPLRIDFDALGAAVKLLDHCRADAFIRRELSLAIPAASSAGAAEIGLVFGAASFGGRGEGKTRCVVESCSARWAMVGIDLVPGDIVAQVDDVPRLATLRTAERATHAVMPSAKAKTVVLTTLRPIARCLVCT